MSENSLYCFETARAGGVVDAEAAKISGVSMITGDVTAKGHDLEVDATTLQQILMCAKKMGKVPVKTNHGSGVDCVNGYLENFALGADKKLRADWHLLKSYPQTSQLLEMADRMPESVGLSVAFHGTPELADGRPVFTELDANGKVKFQYTLDREGKKVPLKPGEKKFARCSELVSTDLVASPAANPDGMFARGDVDKRGEGMANSNPSPNAAAGAAPTAEPTMADVMKLLQGISGRLDAIEAGGQHEEHEENELELSEEQIAKGLKEGWLAEDAEGNLSMVGEPPDDEGGEHEAAEAAANADTPEQAQQEAAAALQRGDLVTFMLASNRVNELRFNALVAERNAEKRAAQHVAEQEALHSFQAKVSTLTTQFEAQKTQLEAKDKLIAELRGQQPRVRSGGDATMFGNPNTAGEVTFESKVAEVHQQMLTSAPTMKEFARKEAATRAVMQAHPDLYTAHLKKKGVMA